VKVNLAFFEAFGSAGLAALERLRATLPADVPFIADAKRGDVASTATRHAAALYDALDAHAVTVAPYVGGEALAPLLERRERCVYVVCRTSNPGAGEFQDLPVPGDAATGAPGGPLYLRVADLVAKLGAGHVGAAGYSDVGAVAGATAPASLRLVREALPNAFLLVPGFGAQGAGPEALAGIAAGEAAGFVVSASRSIIYAWQQGVGDFRRAAALAAESMRNELPFGQ